MRAIDSNVYRSQAIENTLQLIAGAGKDTKLFPTLRDALSFAATLGYQEGRKLPLDPNVGRDDIQSPVYNNNEAVDIIFSIGIADTGSVDILKPENEKDCIKISCPVFICFLYDLALRCTRYQPSWKTNKE